MTSPVPPWDPDDMDRAIKAERRKDKRLKPLDTHNRLDSDQARGYLTDEELRRRKAADRALTKQNPKKEGQR